MTIPTNEELRSIEQTIVPFGKFKGRPFDEIPLGYLDWLVGQDWLFADLREQLGRYLSHPTIAQELERELAD